MSWLPPRAANAHKGHFGHLLVVAGDRGFGGAGLLAAEAAARSGAGLVSLATRPEYVTAALARCPSVMVHGLIHGSELPPLLDAASVVVCGPGIGRGAWGQQMLAQVIASDKPRVLDADALNLLSGRVAVPADNHVLTPHPGEAARLLKCLVPEVEADRVAAARKLQTLYGGTVLLKGAGTVVASDGGALDVISGSNPGCALGHYRGGSGADERWAESRRARSVGSPGCGEQGCGSQWVYRIDTDRCDRSTAGGFSGI
jgi:NAD(P)H-hydrate epimerase